MPIWHAYAESACRPHGDSGPATGAVQAGVVQAGVVEVGVVEVGVTRPDIAATGRWVGG
jgi:hypothetical protein